MFAAPSSQRLWQMALHLSGQESSKAPGLGGLTCSEHCEPALCQSLLLLLPGTISCVHDNTILSPATCVGWPAVRSVISMSAFCGLLCPCWSICVAPLVRVRRLCRLEVLMPENTGHELSIVLHIVWLSWDKNLTFVSVSSSEPAHIALAHICMRPFKRQDAINLT